MKDLLKDFNIESVIKHLSDQTIDLLVSRKCDNPKPDLDALRKDKKIRATQKAIAEAFCQQPQCFRVLRVAFFFHKNRGAFRGLRSYLTEYCAEKVDWSKIDAAKSEAEQTVLLFLEQEGHVHEYFVMCLHTQQGKMYCSCRKDYTNGQVSIPNQETLETLKEKLLTGLQHERGSQFSNTRSFSHEGKTFLLLEFDDLPTHHREFEKDKKQFVDRYPRLALDLVYVFDTHNKTIDTIAETPEIRLQMHQVCAEVIYKKTAIDARPPKNEIFDLQALLNAVIEGTSLVSPLSDTGVKQAFVSLIRVRRTKHPFWQLTLDIKIPKNHLETQDDRVQEIKNIAKVINTKSDSGGWWHQSYVEATQAELFVVYWDETEKKDVSKRVAVNSSGETGLVHDETDENIKQFFREIKLMKARGDEERDDSESKDAATQVA